MAAKVDPSTQKTILVVEDDDLTMRFYQTGLRPLQEFRFLLAANGQQAVEVLQKERVDVLMTDLNMPVMDGYKLVAHMTRHYPSVPIIVITGMGDGEMKPEVHQIKGLRILHKPMKLSVLMDEIRAAGSQEPAGKVRGISLGSLLQLMNWEQKSSTLTVRSQDDQGQMQTGYLYVKHGELIHAAFQNEEGIPAAYTILGWDRPEVEFVETCRMHRTMELPITEILMNVAMIRDHETLDATQIHLKGLES
ncbi:MAG: response regulator [Holophagaceae bacterium]|nr:response regulator [Holophagaceae bacterium]